MSLLLIRWLRGIITGPKRAGVTLAAAHQADATLDLVPAYVADATLTLQSAWLVRTTISVDDLAPIAPQRVTVSVVFEGADGTRVDVTNARLRYQAPSGELATIVLTHGTTGAYSAAVDLLEPGPAQLCADSAVFADLVRPAFLDVEVAGDGFPNG